MKRNEQTRRLTYEESARVGLGLQGGRGSRRRVAVIGETEILEIVLGDRVFDVGEGGAVLFSRRVRRQLEAHVVVAAQVAKVLHLLTLGRTVHPPPNRINTLQYHSPYRRISLQKIILLHDYIITITIITITSLSGPITILTSFKPITILYHSTILFKSLYYTNTSLSSPITTLHSLYSAITTLQSLYYTITSLSSPITILRSLYYNILSLYSAITTLQSFYCTIYYIILLYYSIIIQCYYYIKGIILYYYVIIKFYYYI